MDILSFGALHNTTGTGTACLLDMYLCCSSSLAWPDGCFQCCVIFCSSFRLVTLVKRNIFMFKI